MKRIIIMAMTCMAIYVCAQQAGQSPCASPKAHEFDFWIGKWTVFKNGTNNVVGYNNIVPVAGGCGIQENWVDASGKSIGTSLNKFDPNKGKWQQFWIDNSGQTLELMGDYAGAKMIMNNPTNRITWFNNADGTVRQLWEQTSDNGVSWTVALDGLYKK
jgi:hypothetical protein